MKGSKQSSIIATPNSSRSNKDQKSHKMTRMMIGKKNRTIEMDLEVPDQKTVEARRIDLNFFDKRFYSPNKVKI